MNIFAIASRKLPLVIKMCAGSIRFHGKEEEEQEDDEVDDEEEDEEEWTMIVSCIASSFSKGKRF